VRFFNARIAVGIKANENRKINAQVFSNLWNLVSVVPLNYKETRPMPKRKTVKQETNSARKAVARMCTRLQMQKLLPQEKF
jgi:hypothetical protein